MNGFQFVSRADGDVDGLTVAEARAAQSQTPTLPKGWAGVSRLLPSHGGGTSVLELAGHEL